MERIASGPQTPQFAVGHLDEERTHAEASYNALLRIRQSGATDSFRIETMPGNLPKFTGNQEG